MLPQLLEHFTLQNGIKASKALRATCHVITVLAHHVVLVSLFYLPRCMQARAEVFVEHASRLEEEYHATWTSIDGVGIRRRAYTQVEWLNDDTIQSLTLRRLAVGWRRHVEHCQLRWTKVLGFVVSVAIGLIQANGPGQNQILVCLVVVRGAVASVHLVAFHVIVYPRAKELRFLMKYLSTSGNSSSLPWILLSLPLASILWFMTSILVLAMTFVFNPPTTLLNDRNFDFPTSTIFSCMITDAIPIGWIYYQYKHLHC